MTTNQKITRDGCGADLSDGGQKSGYRLNLRNEFILPDKSHDPPPLDQEYHFCNTKCLDQWCTQGRIPPIKTKTQWFQERDFFSTRAAVVLKTINLARDCLPLGCSTPRGRFCDRVGNEFFPPVRPGKDVAVVLGLWLPCHGYTLRWPPARRTRH